MLAVIAVLALQAATASPAPTAPPPQPSAAALSPEQELVELQRVYQESCETRAYGSFDDVCSNLADQISAFRRQMRRDERRRAKTPTPAAPAPDAR